VQLVFSGDHCAMYLLDNIGGMTPAHDAHEMEHMLSHMAYDWPGTQAGIATPSMTGMPDETIADAN
jgi:hypothetical protein